MSNAKQRRSTPPSIDLGRIRSPSASPPQACRTCTSRWWAPESFPRDWAASHRFFVWFVTLGSFFESQVLSAHVKFSAFFPHSWTTALVVWGFEALVLEGKWAPSPNHQFILVAPHTNRKAPEMCGFHFSQLQGGHPTVNMIALYALHE